MDPLALEALHAKIAQLEERAAVVRADYDRVRHENDTIRPRLAELEAHNAMLRHKLEHYARSIKLCEKCEYKPLTETHHSPPRDGIHPDLWQA